MLSIKWSRPSVTILRYILHYQDRRGYPPTLAEIQSRLNYRDFSTARYHVNRMIRAGILKKESNRARSIQIVDFGRALRIANDPEWSDIIMTHSREFNPTRIYEESELTQNLGGLATVEELKENGLVGSFENGYWGSNIIQSINNLVESRSKAQSAVKKK